MAFPSGSRARSGRASRWAPTLAGFALALAAPAAHACATCVATAYGNRGFNWAFVGLMAMPFVVLTVIAARLICASRGCRTAWTRSVSGT